MVVARFEQAGRAASGPIGAIAANILSELELFSPGQPTRRDLLAEVLHFACEAEHMLAQRTRQIADLKATTTEDELTGVANRRGLQRAFARSVAFAARYGETSALIRIDLLAFDQLAQQASTLALDAALRDVARQLSNQTRSCDLVARLGRREFAILLERCPAQRAPRRAERACAGIGEIEVATGGAMTPLQAVFGVAPITGESNLTGALARAERDLAVRAFGAATMC